MIVGFSGKKGTKLFFDSATGSEKKKFPILNLYRGKTKNSQIYFPCISNMQIMLYNHIFKITSDTGLPTSNLTSTMTLALLFSLILIVNITTVNNINYSVSQ